MAQKLSLSRKLAVIFDELMLLRSCDFSVRWLYEVYIRPTFLLAVIVKIQYFFIANDCRFSVMAG